MSKPQEVKADTITLEVKVVGGGGHPKLKLKVHKPAGNDIADTGLDSHPVEPDRDLVIRAIPAPGSKGEGQPQIDRLHGCHACGDPDNLTTWTSGWETRGELKRGAATDRNGYFTVIARLEDGTYASADPPIIVRRIIPPR